MRRIVAPCIAVLLLAGGAALLLLPSFGGDDEPGAASGRVAESEDLDAIRSGRSPADCELPDTPTLADANLGFAWRSFKAIDATAREDDAATTTYSPYSAATALQMLANGADADVEARLLASLCLEGASLGDANERARLLRERLTRGDEVTISNGIWTVPPHAPAPRLDIVVRDTFDGELAVFSGPDQVDRWIEQRTKGRIKDMLVGVDLSDLAMLLVNAVTFDGTWKTEFEAPRPGTFAVAGTKGVKVPMLRSERSLDYAFSEQDFEWWDADGNEVQAPEDAFHAARIPYVGGRYAMVVVVPEHETGLDRVIERLGPEGWRTMRASLEPQPVALAVPTLDLAEQRMIHPELFALGVPERTYNSLFEVDPVDPARISFVKQGSFLQVDERGTKAAAAVVVGVSVSAGGPVGVPVQADHPYLLAIEEVATGELLFLSAVRDPRGD